MLMKLLVSVFERAKSKITSTRSIGRISSDSDTEFDTNNSKQISSSGPLIIHQQPRLSLSKWLCTNQSSIEKSIYSTKSSKVRRSSSWRSLKERGNNSIGHYTSRTLSVDELNRNQKNNSISKRNSQQHNFLNSPMISSVNSHKKSIRLSNIDSSTNISRKTKRFNRLTSRKTNEEIYLRNNTNSGGGDSGYSEESFATRTISSLKRPLHTSCPHCHCEQRSSFKNYKKSIENSSADSSSSDTTVDTSQLYYKIYQDKQSLSTSRSYPHIKPLPKIINEQQKKIKTISARRRRHLSCDSSLWTKTQQTIPLTSQTDTVPLQRHFTTIGMMHYNPLATVSTLPKTNQVFGELNLAAIELDSLHRTSLSSSYSSVSSSSQSSMNYHKTHTYKKGTYLVWHEYKNSSLLSATNGPKIFSVIRGDQVKLLKRIGKSTLLVQKEDDGAIGFLPQSCLAHDQINSFLSVKGLRETVL